MSLVEYPSDTELSARYQQIDRSAREVIATGRLLGNPLLRNDLRGTGWSISAQGFVIDSSAGAFLASAQEALRSTASFELIPQKFFHITLTELIYHTVSRKAAKICPQAVRVYHDALLTNFPQEFAPIRLRLHTILPTLDPERSEIKGRTGAVVGAFLTEGDYSVFKVKEALTAAIEQSGLPLSTRLGSPPKVLFVTLGRFREAPTILKGRIPLLETIDQLNAYLSVTQPRTEIKDIKIISTSPLDYASPRGHIEIWPPLALEKENQIAASTKFLTPTERLWYHRMQKLLGETK